MKKHRKSRIGRITILMVVLAVSVMTSLFIYGSDFSQCLSPNGEAAGGLGLWNTLGQHGVMHATSGGGMYTGLVSVLGLAVLSIFNFRKSIGGGQSIETCITALQNIADGKLEEFEKFEESNSAMGRMGAAINRLVEETVNKTEFSKQIGSGFLNAEYEPSSEQDELGNSLVKMRNNLSELISNTREAIWEAGDQGNLSSRIQIDQMEGAWRDLSGSINSLLDTLSKPLFEFNKLFKNLANGDLSLRYTDESNGDVKRMTDNLNSALDNIDGLLHQISNSAGIIDESSSEMKVSSEEMSTNTKEIASAISQISHGAQNQLTKVDESSNLIEEILGSSTIVGEKAENINQAAKLGVERSESGMKMVTDMVTSMGDISTHSEQANKSIGVLTDRSNEIARVLGVITDIASQTNLLALNAAIEAAQAGDAGRGFAVVAEEIRKLAEDSRNSAKEIEKLINDVQVDTQSAAQSIDVMASSVKTGEQTSRTAVESFENMLNMSNEILSFSEEIVGSSKEQTNKINDVVSIIEGVVVIAEQTAAGTEEVASSATELSSGMINYNEKTAKLAEIADTLKEGVSMLKLSGSAEENTALFRMREAFENEKSLLDALLNHSPDFIYFKDLKSNFLRNSMSHAKRFGYDSPEKIKGMNDFDFHGDHAQKAYDDEQKIIETGEAMLNMVDKVDLKNGKINYLSTSKMPLTDLDGNIIGTFGITRDVTDLHLNALKAEEEAKKSIEVYNAYLKEKALMDALMDNIPDTVYFKDKESKFIRYSKSLSKLFGRDDLLGKSDFDFFGEHARQAYNDEQGIIETGEPKINMVQEIDLKGGEKKWESTTKMPLRNEKGEIIGTFGISRDITELKLMEQKLADK